MSETTESMVREDGTYPTVPLRRDMIVASVVQTRVNGVDGANPGPDIRRNLDYFLESIDIAQFGLPSDLLLFHEFPITGFSEWTREQHYNLSIEVPGPEIEEVGKKAKQYNCYIAFGTYAKDPENWPGHILHLMVLMGPDGNVVAKHWKQRNVRGMFPGSEQYTSVIYDVYDRFVEMYGIDAVVPVVQTDIGNIAMSAVQFEPELFRCMAFKGAEIMCRVATGGFEFDDMRMTSYHNSVYTMIANNSVSLGSDGSQKRSYFDEASYGGSGRSAIFGPRGVQIAKAGPFETKEFAMIPMGAFRKKHRIPDVHMDIYKPVFDQYRPRYDHSAYVDYLPQDKREAFANFAKNSRWTHYW
jgi:predicted amidohydrolase